MVRKWKWLLGVALLGLAVAGAQPIRAQDTADNASAPSSYEMEFDLQMERLEQGEGPRTESAAGRDQTGRKGADPDQDDIANQLFAEQPNESAIQSQDKLAKVNQQTVSKEDTPFKGRRYPALFHVLLAVILLMGTVWLVYSFFVETNERTRD